LIIYLQNRFKCFYKGEPFSKEEFRSNLLQSIGNRFLADFSDCNNQPNMNLVNNYDDLKIKWNGQINTLITLCYDLMHCTMNDDDVLIECSNDDIKKLLIRNFVDKKGKPINPLTIETCLNDNRKEKRASGKKRIRVPVYLS